ncbi:beta-carotene 15,15'-dioxygenase-domain-containing protein [Baffinella frigidus]|nr:beta-carotene 15,15'-dioxygenase-domain-containing protein [Cryptophyta sp. CCMP2293]
MASLHFLLWPFGGAMGMLVAYHLWAAKRGVPSSGPPPLAKTAGVRHVLASVEMMVLSTLAGTCPPLITFVVYFCVWHSVRHILCVASATFDPHLPRQALGAFMMHALPFTATTFALAWYFYPSSHAHEGTGGWTAEDFLDKPAIAQMVFTGLSAVTVPHMIITEISQVRQRALTAFRRRDGGRDAERYPSGAGSNGSNAAEMGCRS